MGASKKLVIRGGLDLNGILGSGGSDPVLTRNPSTKEIGETTPLLVGLPTTLLQGYIYIGDNTNTAAARPLSGDISITYLGLATLNDGVIINSKISATAAIAYSKLNLSNSIVDGDVNATAAITRSKLASGATNRIVINSAIGVMTDAAAITPNRALASDANGIPVASTVPDTVLNYLDVSSSVQTQLNNRLSFDSSIVPDEGDLVAFLSGQWQRLPRGTSGQYLTSTVSTLAWVTTPNGVPTGGTTDQYLTKIDNTDYNTQWVSLTLSRVTDVSSTAADLNLLSGADAFGITTSHIHALFGVTSSIQGQLDSKLGIGLPQNYLFVGNNVNQVGTLAPGTNGYVLTMVSGAPLWAAPTGGGGGSGHTIQNSGLALTTRTNLNFTSGLAAQDDAPNNASKAIIDLTYSFVWTGAHSWLDNNFAIKDNSDPSKILNFQLSALSTATTRTYTWPDVTGTVALIDGGQTFTSAVWNASVIGSTYGGAGTVNGILKANGSGTVSAATPGTDYLVTAYYQTIRDSAGTGQTQEPSLKFSASFALTDSAAVSTNVAIANAGITLAMLASSSVTLNTGANFGMTTPGAMTLGSTYTIGATTDNLRFNGLGLGVAAPTTAGQIASTLGANNVTGLVIQRFTDSSPTGNFLAFKNAAGTTLWNVDITGKLTSGTWNGSIIGALYGGTGIDTSGATGVAQVSGGVWSISSALANGTTATTQAANDNSTKVATTGYVNAIITPANQSFALLNYYNFI